MKELLTLDCVLLYTTAKNEHKKKKMNYLGMIGAPQLMLILVLLGIIPFIFALVEILRSKFSGNNKIVWLLVILFLNFFGVVLYFLIGRSQRIKE